MSFRGWSAAPINLITSGAAVPAPTLSNFAPHRHFCATYKWTAARWIGRQSFFHTHTNFMASRGSHHHEYVLAIGFIGRRRRTNPEPFSGDTPGLSPAGVGRWSERESSLWLIKKTFFTKILREASISIRFIIIVDAVSLSFLFFFFCHRSNRVLDLACRRSRRRYRPKSLVSIGRAAAGLFPPEEESKEEERWESTWGREERLCWALPWFFSSSTQSRIVESGGRLCRSEADLLVGIQIGTREGRLYFLIRWFAFRCVLIRLGSLLACCVDRPVLERLLFVFDLNRTVIS